MRNNIRMAIESIAGNTNSLDTVLAAAIQYESAMNKGMQKQGGINRYPVAALEITGSAAASAPSSAPGAAGMQEMKHELAAILSALAALCVQKNGGKPKPPGGAPPWGPRKPAPGSTAGGAGAGRSTSDMLGPVYARDWIKCYMCRLWGQHIVAECTERSRRLTILHQVQICRHQDQQRTLCFTQTAGGSRVRPPPARVLLPVKNNKCLTRKTSVNTQIGMLS
jgi:hypothetical protein